MYCPSANFTVWLVLSKSREEKATVYKIQVKSRPYIRSWTVSVLVVELSAWTDAHYYPKEGVFLAVVDGFNAYSKPNLRVVLREEI